jgi:hypothetical protein
MYFMQFDPNGLQSLLSLGIDVQGCDLTPHTSLAALRDGITQALQEVSVLAAGKKLSGLVVDSLTFLSNQWLAILTKMYPEAKSKGQMFGHLTVLHREFREKLASLPVRIVVTAHSKSLINMFADDGQTDTTLRILGANQSAEIGPDISGGNRGYWIGGSDLICPIVKKKEGYFLLPAGNNIFMGGNRYEGLAAEEPANLHSLLLKAKARKH